VLCTFPSQWIHFPIALSVREGSIKRDSLRGSTPSRRTRTFTANLTHCHTCNTGARVVLVCTEANPSHHMFSTSSLQDRMRRFRWLSDVHAAWTFRKHLSARFPSRQTLLVSRRCASRVRKSSIVIRARGPLNSPQLGEKRKLEGNSSASAFRASSHHLLGVRHGRLTDEIYSADCFNQESPRNVITCSSFTDSSYFVRNAKTRVSFKESFHE